MARDCPGHAYPLEPNRRHSPRSYGRFPPTVSIRAHLLVHLPCPPTPRHRRSTSCQSTRLLPGSPSPPRRQATRLRYFHTLPYQLRGAESRVSDGTMRVIRRDRGRPLSTAPTGTDNIFEGTCASPHPPLASRESFPEPRPPQHLLFLHGGAPSPYALTPSRRLSST